MTEIYAHEIIVAPTDIDILGHASNIMFVRWIQDTALAHSAAVGLDVDAYKELGAVFVVVRHEIDYVRPAMLGDVIEARTWVASVNAAKCVRATGAAAQGRRPDARAGADHVGLHRDRLGPAQAHRAVGEDGLLLGRRGHGALHAAVLAAPVFPRMTGKTGKSSAEIADAAHWDAVEEVVELLHEERFRDAILELRNGLRADAANPYAYYFLGIAFFEIGELEPARDAYAACLKLAPNHIGARVALSHVLRATGSVKGAIREGLDALARSPGHLDALHAVGLAYHAYGDEEAARRYLEAFLASNPEYDAAEEVKEILATLPGGPQNRRGSRLGAGRSPHPPEGRTGRVGSRMGSSRGTPVAPLERD